MSIEKQIETHRLRRFAWLNVNAGFVLIFLMLTTPAILMPIMYGSIMDEMGWTRAQVTGFSSWKFLSGAITSLALGFIIDRFGIRAVVLVGACITATSLVGMYRVNTLWVFYFFGFILGTAAVIASISCRVLLGRWFALTLGQAVGIAFTGGSLAGVITPFTARFLIDTVGWQATAAIFGITIFTLIVPLFLFLVRERPEDYGATVDMIDGNHTSKTTSNGLELSEIYRSRTFWLAIFANFLIGGVDHSMMEHTALFIEKDANLGKIAAAGGVTVAMLASILGKVGFGWLFDRYSMRGIAICWWTLALGILLAFPISGVVTMTIFVIARGASHGGVLVDDPCLAQHLFGTRSIAKLVSFLSAANMLGGALCTVTVGYARDVFGSYTIAFISLICLAVIAGLIIQSLIPQYWHRFQVPPLTGQQTTYT